MIYSCDGKAEFSALFDEQSSKEQHLLEIEILCIVFKFFTVTFDQFNASLVTE